jgi:hypothetical protein
MPAPRLPRLLASAWIAVASAIAPVLVARAEQPTIYKWVDANGVAHYTTDRNRIPSALRDRIEQRQPVIPATPSPVQTPSPDAQAPVAASAPSAPPSPAPVAPAVAPARLAPPAAPAPVARAAVSAPTPTSAGASDLTRDAGPIASPPQVASPPPVASAPPAASPAPVATSGVAVAAPPPFYAEPAPEKPKLPPDSPRQPAPNVAPTVESEGVAPEPTDAKTRTATAEIGPRTPADAAAIAELDRQIADLEARVAKDEDALSALISVPEQQRKGQLVDDPHFREIAKRLPKLQADLQALRERRGTLELSPAPPQ